MLESNKSFKNNTTKPKWLRMLEAQSWQAELLISGLAIFGSLGLPQALSQFIDWSLVTFSDEVLSMLPILMIYISLAIYVLIYGFFIHFILRVFWIGGIGLNSVFPEGINPEEGYYPSYFLKSAKKDLPSLDQFNHNLDQICSVIFSIAALFVMFGIASFLWIGGIMLISTIISNIIGIYTINQIFPILFAIVTIAFLPVGMMRMKRFRNKTWVKSNYYKLFKKLNQSVLFVFYRPLSILTYTIFTNLKKANKYYFFVFIFCIFFVSTFSTKQTNIGYSESKIFADMSTSTNHINPKNYSLNNNTEHRILYPQIERRIVKGDHVNLFIPLFKREKTHISKVCPKFSKIIKGKRSSTLQDKNDKRKLDCYDQYYTLSIDSNIISNVEMQFYTHPNRGESGLLCMLPIGSISNGSHSIYIKKPYVTEDTSSVTQTIRFWKE